MNKLISGGARGADAFFAECADKSRHDIVHYSFHKHKITCPGSIIVLEDKRLYEADYYLNQCNKILKRNIYGMGIFSKNLLRRSMIKVIDNDFDSLYAVTSIKEDGTIEGGTAWAVTLFDILNKGSIFIFDLNTDKWYTKDIFGNLNMINSNLRVQGTYLGIGTRELTNEGKNAISNLYRKE